MSRSPRAADSPPSTSLTRAYTSPRVLLDSRWDYRVALVDLVADDPSWQARAGFGQAGCQIDWDRQGVTCPVGQQSGSCERKVPQRRLALNTP